MTSLKALLGIALACAACCAVPLLGMWTAAVAGSLLLARVDVVLASLALAALAAMLVWRHRRKASRKPACAGSCDGSCRTVT